jgi:hypothetical protein
MDEREARLRGHEQIISHYKNMLKTRLTEVKMHFVERRLAEERFKIAMLEFMSPSHTDSPRAKERAARKPGSGGLFRSQRAQSSRTP